MPEDLAPKIEEFSRGLTWRSGLRKTLKKLPALVPTGEEVLQLDTAIHLGRRGLLVATDRRVLFLPSGPSHSRLDLALEEIVALKPGVDPECGPCSLKISTYDDQIELCDLSRPAVDRLQKGWRSGHEGLLPRKQVATATDREAQEAARTSGVPARAEPPEPAAPAVSPPDPDVTLRPAAGVPIRSERSAEQHDQVRGSRIKRVLYALAVLSLVGLIAELMLGGSSIRVLTGNTPSSTTSTTVPTTTTTTTPPPESVVVIPSTTEPVRPRTTARVTTTRQTTTTSTAELSTTTTPEITTTSERKKKKGG